LAARGNGTAHISLSLSPTRTLVTPYFKRTRPGRGTNTKAASFPFHVGLPLAFPPSRSVSRRPIWAGARDDNLLVGPGTPRGRNADRSSVPNLEGNHAPDRLQWLSGGAPDCPVCHSTEGKDSLPCWPPTTPSCLRAIKGTPRRMEELSKHSLSILRLPHSASAYLIDCVNDLISVRVVNSLCYI
jgi:hypothetical protein